MALYDTESTAIEYGFAPAYLNKARCVGTPNIPYIKIGRLVRYDWEQVDAWMVKHSHNSVEAKK